MKKINVIFSDKTSIENVYTLPSELKPYLVNDMFPGATFRTIINTVINTVGYGDIYIDDGGADPVTGDYRGYDYILSIFEAKNIEYEDFDLADGDDAYLVEYSGDVYMFVEYVS